VLESLHAIDQGVLFRFETLQRPWLSPVMLGADSLGQRTPMLVLALLLVLAFVAARQKRAALILAGISLLSWTLLEGVKRYVDRPRPDLAWRTISLPPSSSFPSGHALTSLAIFLGAALLAARRLRRWVGVLLVLLALATSFLLGVSRMYLGVHYPLDVIGGWTAGLACALLALWADGRWGWRPPPFATRVPPAGSPTIAADSPGEGAITRPLDTGFHDRVSG
jgi:undecaprenyl-diphosphatase